jgi:hypothetical protein
LRPPLPNMTDWHIKYQYNLKTNTILINQTAECVDGGSPDTKKRERSREASRKRRPRLRTGEAAAEADAVEARLRPSRA